MGGISKLSFGEGQRIKKNQNLGTKKEKGGKQE